MMYQAEATAESVHVAPIVLEIALNVSDTVMTWMPTVPALYAGLARVGIVPSIVNRISPPAGSPAAVMTTLLPGAIAPAGGMNVGVGHAGSAIVTAPLVLPAEPLVVVPLAPTTLPLVRVPLLVPDVITETVPKLAPLAVPVVAPPFVPEPPPFPVPGFVLLVRPPQAAITKSANADSDHRRWLVANGSSMHGLSHQRGVTACGYRNALGGSGGAFSAETVAAEMGLGPALSLFVRECGRSGSRCPRRRDPLARKTRWQ